MEIRRSGLYKLYKVCTFCLFNVALKRRDYKMHRIIRASDIFTRRNVTRTRARMPLFVELYLFFSPSGYHSPRYHFACTRVYAAAQRALISHCEWKKKQKHTRSRSITINPISLCDENLFDLLILYYTTP